MEQVLQEQTKLEEEANEVIPFNITSCSKLLGHIRQSVYSCLTCNPIQAGQRAGVCISCSVSCHTDHQLVELFVRRNFVCDCGTQRCNPNKCQLDLPPLPNEQGTHAHSTQPEALINNYDKNFDGQFCICEKGKNYDPEIETEDMYQCLACEDWRHAGCLGPHPDADEWDDLICANCVQNNPIIRSIMFKHAGGDNTGMLVCTHSKPDQVICYGKLSPSSNPDPPSAEETDNGSNIENFNPNPSTQNLIHHQSKNAGMSKGYNEDCVDLKSYNGNQGKRSRTDKELPSSICSQVPIEEEKNKKPRLQGTPTKEQLNDLNFIPTNNPEETSNHNCRAPFKNRSESILIKLDPHFSNVYLVDGWRDRWCKCSDCYAILSKLDWLVQEEEDVWETGEDTESLKSIHELGLEAIKKLPRDQLINGILAYNQFKQQFLNFLKPFHSSNKLITELDIHQFFLNIKTHIVQDH